MCKHLPTATHVVFTVLTEAVKALHLLVLRGPLQGDWQNVTGRELTASSLMRRSDTMSSMMGRASSTFISRFSPLLFRDAITRSSLLIISCTRDRVSMQPPMSRHGFGICQHLHSHYNAHKGTLP